MLEETEKTLKELMRNLPKESLLPAEKAVIKTNILYFMEEHSALSPVPARFSWLVFPKTPALRYVSFAAMAILIGGGTIAFAAQNTLPGDSLYFAKTHVAEKVLALTLFSDQAKAEYDINLAQLRLQETETVAAQNKLNSQSTSEVRSLLNNHITDIQNRILGIKSKENARVAVELNSELEALLKAHAGVMKLLAENKKGDDAKDMQTILSDVKDKTDQITKNREDNESALSLQISANAKINAESKLLQVEAMIREANALLANGNTAITYNSRQNAQTNLATANQNIADGKSALRVKDYNQAFILFTNASRVIREITIYISNETRLKGQFDMPATLSPGPSTPVNNEGSKKKDITDDGIDLETGLKNIIK